MPRPKKILTEAQSLAEGLKSKKIKLPAVKKVKVNVPENIDEAIFYLQGEVFTIPLNGRSTIDGKEYQYALLEDINAILTPYLQKYGMNLSCIVSNENLVIEAAHVKSRTSRMSTIPLGKPSSTHDFGARMTHFRRYGIAALFNLILDRSNVPVVHPSASQSMPTGQTTASSMKVETNDPTIMDAIADQQATTTQASDAFTAAKARLDTAVNPEAIRLLYKKIDDSVKLTPEEKDGLKKLAEIKLKEVTA